MLNELAEIIGQLEFSEENRKKSRDVYSHPVLRKSETEAILKALRFAGYMEKLRNDPIFYMQEVISTGEIEIVTSAGRVSDKCIYSAARKAVEALEKGEGK